MAHSFAELRQSRKNELDKLNKELDKMSTGGGTRTADTRYWAPTVDKLGNGYAVIRFLTAPKGEDLPFVRYWDHGFKGPGGQWYIENSRKSLGDSENDPVAEMNQKYWAEGENSRGRKIVSGDGNDKPGSKRRLHFVANIYVVADPSNKQNEGKVFLYKFGKRIFDKLNDAMHPPVIEGLAPEMQQEAFNPFDMWEGANFALKIRKVDGQRSYADSAFIKPCAPLLKSDEAMEKLWEQEYPLKELLDPKNFKSYAELKAKLDRVMGDSITASTAERSRIEDEEAPPVRRTAPARHPVKEDEVVEHATAQTDPLDYFEKLANG